eukprot:gene23271-biopygen4308
MFSNHHRLTPPHKDLVTHCRRGQRLRLRRPLLRGDTGCGRGQSPARNVYHCVPFAPRGCCRCAGQIDCRAARPPGRERCGDNPGRTPRGVHGYTGPEIWVVRGTPYCTERVRPSRNIPLHSIAIACAFWGVAGTRLREIHAIFGVHPAGPAGGVRHAAHAQVGQFAIPARTASGSGCRCNPTAGENPRRRAMPPPIEGFIQNSREQRRAAGISEEQQPAAGSSTQQHGAPRSSPEQPGAARSSLEQPGAARSRTEQHGTARSSREQERRVSRTPPSASLALWGNEQFFRLQWVPSCSSMSFPPGERLECGAEGGGDDPDVDGKI